MPYILTPQPLPRDTPTRYLQPPRTAVSVDIPGSSVDSGMKRRRVNSATYGADLMQSGLNKMIANERAENIQHMRDLMQVMRETGPPTSPPRESGRPTSAGRKRAYSVKNKKTKVNKSFGSLFGGSKPEKPLPAEGKLYTTRTVSGGAKHHQIIIPPEADPGRREVTIQEPLQLYSDEKETFVSKKPREGVARHSYTNHYTHLQGSDDSRPSTKDSPMNLTAEELGWSGAAFERLSSDDRDSLHRSPEMGRATQRLRDSGSTKRSSSNLRRYASSHASESTYVARHKQSMESDMTKAHRRGQSNKSEADGHDAAVRIPARDVPRRRSSRSTSARPVSIEQMMDSRPSTRPRKATEGSVNQHLNPSPPESESRARNSQISTNASDFGASSLISDVSSGTIVNAQAAQIFGPSGTQAELVRQPPGDESQKVETESSGPGPAPTRALPELPRGSDETGRHSNLTVRPDSQSTFGKGRGSPVERLALSRSDSVRSDNMEEFMNMSAQEARAKRDRRKQHVNAIKSKHTMSSRARNENKRLILSDVTAKAKTPAGRAMIEASPVVPDSATIPPRLAESQNSPPERHIRTPSDQERGIEQVNRARAASQSELMEARSALLKAKRSSRRLSRSTDPLRPSSAAATRPGSSAAGSINTGSLRPRTPKPSTRNNQLSPIIPVFDQPPSAPAPFHPTLGNMSTIAPTVYQKRHRQTPSGALLVRDRDFMIDTRRPATATATVSERLLDSSMPRPLRYHEPTPPRSPSNFAPSTSSSDDEMKRRMSDMLLNPRGSQQDSAAMTAGPNISPAATGTDGVASGRQHSRDEVLLSMTPAEFETRVHSLVDERLGTLLRELLIRLPTDQQQQQQHPCRAHLDRDSGDQDWREEGGAAGEVQPLRTVRSADGERRGVTMQAKVGGRERRSAGSRRGFGYEAVGSTIESLLAGLESGRRESGIGGAAVRA